MNDVHQKRAFIKRYARLVAELTGAGCMMDCALRRTRKGKNSKIESHNQEENAQASAEVNDGDQANDKEGSPVLCAGHFSGSSSES